MAGSRDSNDHTWVKKMTAITPVYSDPELKKLAVRRAKKDKVPVSELFCRAMAAYLGRPELGAVPRATPGRKANDPDAEEAVAS